MAGAGGNGPGSREGGRGGIRVGGWGGGGGGGVYTEEYMEGVEWN